MSNSIPVSYGISANFYGKLFITKIYEEPFNLCSSDKYLSSFGNPRLVKKSNELDVLDKLEQENPNKEYLFVLVYTIKNEDSEGTIEESSGFDQIQGELVSKTNVLDSRLVIRYPVSIEVITTYFENEPMTISSLLYKIKKLCDLDYGVFILDN